MTPQCKEELRRRLKEAELAYHRLMMGGGIRSLRDQNGEQTEYTSANSSRLYAYIQTLKAQLGEDACGHVVQPTRPMQPFF